MSDKKKKPVEEKNVEVVHSETDTDFNVYYNTGSGEVEITGLYLYGNQVDLVDIVSDEVKEDLQQEIEDSFE